MLSPGTVHVVWAPHDGLAGAAADLLSDVEQARADRLRQPDDRLRSTTAAALLRVVAGDLAGVPPADLDVVRRCRSCGGPHGRPELPGTGLHASVSHAGGWCVVALTDLGPVGVDVEAVRQVDVAALSSAVLAPEEAVPDLPGFYVLWTRKEAVVKATGEGLLVPLDQVVVAAPGEPPTLVRCPGVADGGGVIRDLAAPQGYAAALAVLPAPGREVADVRETVLVAAPDDRSQPAPPFGGGPPAPFREAWTRTPRYSSDGSR
jgi:4'-phosphopantetheinyl transferase